MGKILQFEIPKIPVVACCDTCLMTKMTLVTESQYQKYLRGEKKICPCCKSPTLHYCLGECDG